MADVHDAPETSPPSRLAARDDILRGPLTPALLRLAWPTAMTAAMQGLLAMIDMILVGRLGADAVAAVGSSRQMMMVLMVAGSAVAAGSATLVAQSVGRGSPDQANHVMTQGLIVFTVAIVVVLIPAGWFLSPHLAGWLLRDEPRVVALAVPFLRVAVLSALFTMTGFSVQASLRGAGDTITPLRLTAYENVLKIVCDLIFIFGLPGTSFRGWGVLGAAIASVTARGVVNAIMFWWLLSGRLPLRLLPVARWRLDLSVLAAMLKIGVPTSISSLVLNVFGLLVIAILSRTEQGAIAVTAYTISLMLRNLGTWTTWGLSEATMAMVGQNVGAGQIARAAATGHAAGRLGCWFMLGLGSLLAAAAPFVLPLLLKEPDVATKAAVMALGVRFLRSNVLGLPPLGAGMSFEGALRGAGDALAPLVQNLISLMLVGVGISAILALDAVHLGPLVLPGAGLGPDGVWIGLILAGCCRGLLGWYRWRSGAWRRPAEAAVL